MFSHYSTWVNSTNPEDLVSFCSHPCLEYFIANTAKDENIVKDLLHGIPDIEDEKVSQFVQNTNTLLNTIGTTLLVKASSHFEETDLKIKQINIKSTQRDLEKVNLVQLHECKNESLGKEIKNVDEKLNQITEQFIHLSIQKIEDFHHNLISRNTEKLDAFLEVIRNSKEFDIDKKSAVKTGLCSMRLVISLYLKFFR